MTKKNAATQSMMVKFKQAFYAEGRYLRVLWWEWWQEKPLAAPPLCSDVTPRHTR
jgi:hypothetical protein